MAGPDRDESLLWSGGRSESGGRRLQGLLPTEPLLALAVGTLSGADRSSSRPGRLVRSADWWRRPAFWPLQYLGLIALAETIAILAGQLPALALQAVLLGALANHGVSRADASERGLLCALGLVPMARIYRRTGICFRSPGGGLAVAVRLGCLGRYWRLCLRSTRWRR